MSDDQEYLKAVAETCERLQVEPKDLLGYVFWLRERYAECVQALFDIREFSTDSQASELAREVLLTVGAAPDDEKESYDERRAEA